MAGRRQEQQPPLEPRLHKVIVRPAARLLTSEGVAVQPEWDLHRGRAGACYLSSRW